MPAWISACVRATFQSRTSVIRPFHRASPDQLLFPMKLLNRVWSRGKIAVWVLLFTSTPLMYSLRFPFASTTPAT